MSTERVISIYSSRGGSKKITTGVSTWGELLPLVKAQGYPVADLHVSESVRKSTLEHVDAILPEGDFTLFMRPKKTKSGAKAKRADNLNKKELTSLVKEDIASSSNGKEFYAGYSSMTVADLATKVNTFKAKVAKAPVAKAAAKAPAKAAGPKVPAKNKIVTKAAPKPAVKKAVGKVVESVKKSKAPAEVVETQADMDKRLAKEAADFERGLR